MRNNFLKTAVLGAGYMGQNHIRVLSSQPNVNIIAVCDIDRHKTKILAKQYKIKEYNNFYQLIRNEALEVIFICLPTSLHFQAAREALTRKIAVFVEKPICDSVVEAKKLIRLSNINKTALMVGHIERFNPVVNEIKHRIKSGELGKLLQIHTQRFSPPPARAHDVSAIIDLATHDIDIILYLVNEKPVRIYSETENRYHKKEDLMASLLRFKSGTIGLAEVSWLHPTKTRNLTVVGSNGMYTANYLTQELFFYKQNNKAFNNKYRNNRNANTWADVVKIAFEAREPLEIELEAFIEALRARAKMPVSGQDGLQALEMAQKMAKSGQIHKIVK